MADQYAGIRTLERRLCLLRQLFHHGSMSRICGILHQPSRGHRQWCCHGDVLQKATRAVYGTVDFAPHSRLVAIHREILSCVDDIYADESISGPPLGPFVMGFVVTQTGNYRWIYRVLAIINGVQFLFALFLQPETLYIRKGVQHVGSAFKQEYLTFGRLDPKPLKMYEFIQPLSLFKYPSILIPTIAYSMVFGFCSVLLTVEIPQLFIPKFGFNAQQIGLQFLGIIIGSLIGEQIGGRLSDFWMHRKAKQMAYHAPPPPEHRLWLSYFGFVLAMVGLIVFGVRFQQLPAHQYDVSPIVGIAISAVGNQIVTTVSTTYAIDCHFEHSASIGIFINVIRSTWAFIGKSAAAEEGERINPSLPHPYPIPCHCDGTHTHKIFYNFFFSSAGDGTNNKSYL